MTFDTASTPMPSWLSKLALDLQKNFFKRDGTVVFCHLDRTNTFAVIADGLEVATIGHA